MNGLGVAVSPDSLPYAGIVSMPIQSVTGKHCGLVGLQNIAEEYRLDPFDVNADSKERALCDRTRFGRSGRSARPEFW